MKNKKTCLRCYQHRQGDKEGAREKSSFKEWCNYNTPDNPCQEVFSKKTSAGAFEDGDGSEGGGEQ